VAAWIAEQGGNSAAALDLLRSAVQLEESMDKHAVTPGPVTPAREMLAEVLLLEKRPQDSLAEYEAVLKLAPNRFNALYGAATAADAAGNKALATRHFQELLAIGVGDERQELTTARKKIALSARNDSREQ
jgi:tetratricopeptide (TPR) repeat protein